LYVYIFETENTLLYYTPQAQRILWSTSSSLHGETQDYRSGFDP
jgi:hypothetical protein